jgi:hypothetical protein
VREGFLAYKIKTKADFSHLWQHAHFSFDANILLGAYELTSQSRAVLFEQLHRLGSRSFLTHQAGLEFYRNRPRIIASARKNLEIVATALEEIPAAFSEAARNALAKLMKEESEQISKFLSEDPIEAEFDSIFAERYCKSLPHQEDLYREIDMRFERKIPPGFADAASKEDFRRYGDALIWFELIEYAKDKNVPIVLVTSETKHDWWHKENQKTLGPRPELAQEMWEKAGVMFHLYSLSEFLKYSQQELKGATVEHATEAIGEAQRLEDRREGLDVVESLAPPIEEIPPPPPHSWERFEALSASRMAEELRRADLATSAREQALKDLGAPPTLRAQLEELRRSGELIRRGLDATWPKMDAQTAVGIAKRQIEEVEKFRNSFGVSEAYRRAYDLSHAIHNTPNKSALDMLYDLEKTRKRLSEFANSKPSSPSPATLKPTKKTPATVAKKRRSKPATS